MIQFGEAILIAGKYLEDMQAEIGVPLQISNVREERFGWLFSYQSKEYIETENFSAMLAGNAPFIVDRDDATIHVLGTAYPVDCYLSEYAKRRER